MEKTEGTAIHENWWKYTGLDQQYRGLGMGLLWVLLGGGVSARKGRAGIRLLT